MLGREENIVTIREKIVSFCPSSINKIYGLQNMPNVVGNHIIFSPTKKDLKEAVETVGRPGSTWEIKHTGLHILRPKFLNNKAIVWVYLSKLNLMPTTHDSSSSATRVLLCRCIMHEIELDKDQIIVVEIKATTVKGLGCMFFPRLICDLCLDAEV